MYNMYDGKYNGIYTIEVKYKNILFCSNLSKFFANDFSGRSF